MIWPYSWFSMTTMATCENAWIVAGLAVASGAPLRGLGTAPAPALVRRMAAVRPALSASIQLRAGRRRSRRGICTRSAMLRVSAERRDRFTSRSGFDVIIRHLAWGDRARRSSGRPPRAPPPHAVGEGVPGDEQHHHGQGPGAVVEMHGEPDPQMQQHRPRDEEPGGAGLPQADGEA